MNITLFFSSSSSFPISIASGSSPLLKTLPRLITAYFYISSSSFNMGEECIRRWINVFMLFFIYMPRIFSISMFIDQSIELASDVTLFNDSESNSCSVHHTPCRRKLHDIGGSISIDCGISDEFSYTDNKTEIQYSSDATYIDTGMNRNISSQFNSQSTLPNSLMNLRSFPLGNRNCYTLRPPEGRSTVYLIRATFMYGNYDNFDRLPRFDLYIGVNMWDTVGFNNASHVVVKEILHVPSLDFMQICLVNTGQGTPFISALELRHFHDSSYRTVSGSLMLYRRLDFGSTTNQIIRFKDDVYDRIWMPCDLPNTIPISTSNIIDSLGNTNYRPPSAVMSTAVIPTNASNSSLDFEFDIGDSTLEFYVYMHFAELEKLQQNQYRAFNIFLNGNLWREYVVPNYLHSTTIFSPQSVRGSKLRFSISMTSNSTLPPILNAMEIYIVKDMLQAPTDQEDVKAITQINSRYGVEKIWQGDPCLPKESWDGLNCSYNGYDPPRIISLNLGSSGLTGEISSSLSNLKSLEYLDLSNNSLTGPLPDSLSQLPSLCLLNVSGNDLSGSIPPGLLAKSRNGSLTLSISGNPDICLSATCEKKKNLLVPLVAGIGSTLVVLIALVVLWLLKRKRQVVKIILKSPKGAFKSNNRQFSYYEVISITNNFQTVIGKGGFGTVYHGYLKDGSQVAVKMLSPTSTQGSKQFQAEAQLLMRVHHKNLASFVGYCDEGTNMGLIYEYMANGNLREHLSDKSRNALSWKVRLQIAVDAAQGLEYLHNGCKPPIIHRDVKTSNILLNENFQAKLADFGLSRDHPTEGQSYASTAVVGTLGYLDPEYYVCNRLTEKSDVYSFGIVLLEIITSKQAIIKSHENTNIVQWVSSFLARGDIRKIVDPRLKGDFDSNSVWKAIETAMACVPSVSIQRPSMSHVVIELKECLEIERAFERSLKMGEEDLYSLDLETEMGPEAR